MRKPNAFYFASALLLISTVVLDSATVPEEKGSATQTVKQSQNSTTKTLPSPSQKSDKSQGDAQKKVESVSSNRETFFQKVFGIKPKPTPIPEKKRVHHIARIKPKPKAVVSSVALASRSGDGTNGAIVNSIQQTSPVEGEIVSALSPLSKPQLSPESNGQDNLTNSAQSTEPTPSPVIEKGRFANPEISRRARSNAFPTGGNSTDIQDTKVNASVQQARFGLDPAVRAVRESFPWHENITSTVFWIGEPGNTKSPTNVISAWDHKWQSNNGGKDSPVNRRGFFPASFAPEENPFYVALPYNDVEAGHTKSEARNIVPWFNQVFQCDGQSVLKNRWIMVRKGPRICFAQWEDVGPFHTDNWQYVFGHEEPRPNQNSAAGIDLSPAIRQYLGLKGIDRVDWRFCNMEEVQPGPWSIFGRNNSFAFAVPQTQPEVTNEQNRRDKGPVER
jgi:hypothetical protein